MVKKVQKSKKSQKTFDTYGDYIEEQDTNDPIEEQEESEADIDEETLPVHKKTILKKDVKKIAKSAKDNINSSRKLLKLFRAACHTNDENAADFESPEAFNLIIVSSLKVFPSTFRKIFKDKEIKPSIRTSYKNLFRSFLSNTLFLLKQVRESALLLAIFKGLCKVSRFLSFFIDYSKNFIKIAALI